ncbi:MAG: gliding motility-associated C-terminal domain-containing protein [Sphingobacteriales bacterium]|nr:gliding motility-associated C-terminal domain-containing protein [Sphingobacteriales bacterium]
MRTNPQTFAITLSGGATSATISSDGSGSLSVTNISASGDVIYTPSATDFGNTITITIVTNDPDGAGVLCSSFTTTASINVEGLPTADAGAEATIDCINTSVSIGTPAIAGNIYAWSPNIGGINPTSAITTVSDLASTQIYTLTVTNASGCTATDQVTVAVIELPTAPLVSGLNNPYCVGEAVDVLTATPSQGGTITWYGNTDLTLVLGTGTNYTPPTGVQAGTVSYWVAEAANGCVGTATQVDVVFEICVSCNVAAPTGITTALTTCEGTANTTAFEVTNNDPNATIYWYDADGTEVGTGNTFVPIVAGNYTAVAVSNDNPNCVSTAITTILTETNLGDAGFVYDNDTYCQGTTNITPTITGTSGGTFSATGGLVINPLTGEFDATIPGTFTITYQVTGNCTATNTFVVTIVPSIVIAISGDAVLTLGESTQLVASGATSYIWSSDPTLSCTNCANPIATPTQTTTYTVQTAGEECAEPATITVVVNPIEPKLIVPNAFSPNNDGTNDVFRATSTGGLPETFELMIYDRWETKLYEASNITLGWDGTYKGFDCELGVYVFSIKYNFTGNTTKYLSGNLTLVR